MPSQRIDSRPCARTGTDEPSDGHDQGHVEGATIALLLSDDHHGLWSREELIRELSASRLEVVDALASLAAATRAAEDAKWQTLSLSTDVDGLPAFKDTEVARMLLEQRR